CFHAPCCDLPLHFVPHDALPICLLKKAFLHQLLALGEQFSCVRPAQSAVGRFIHNALTVVGRMGKGALSVCAGGHRCSSPTIQRSEEHTSELQSRENLVCRLLLE